MAAKGRTSGTVLEPRETTMISRGDWTWCHRYARHVVQGDFVEGGE